MHWGEIEEEIQWVVGRSFPLSGRLVSPVINNKETVKLSCLWLQKDTACITVTVAES